MQHQFTRTNSQVIVEGKKPCSVCNRYLPLDAFTVDPGKSSGYASACKECKNKRARRAEMKLRRMKLQDQHCWFCGVKLDETNYSTDHFIPRAAGGSDHPANLILSCRSCNCAKRDFPLETFREIRRRQRDNVPHFGPEQRAYLRKHGIVLPEGEPFLFWGESMNTQAKGQTR